MKRLPRPLGTLALLGWSLAALPTPILSHAWSAGLAADGAWLQIPAPEGFLSHTAIHDPVHGRMLIFGGYGGRYRDEVLALDLDGPAVLSPVSTSGTRPSGRYDHVATYDASRERMLVFGGLDSLQGYRNDVWALSLAGPTPTWSQLTPSGTPPSARIGSSAIYDPLRDRLVVFGGFDGSYPPLDDVWALNLSGAPEWVLLVPSISLPPYGRHSHSAIYDAAGDRMIIFGGMTSASENDVWALSLSGTPTWSPIAPPEPKPGERWDHVAIYDPLRGRMLVHGGRVLTAFPYGADLWALSLTGAPAWSRIDTSDPAPAGRAHHVAIYDPVGDRMVLFGGSAGEEGRRDDAWGLTLAGSPAWTELRRATTPPSGRSNPSSILDPARNRMVVFAGGVAGIPSRDVTTMTLGPNPAWSELETFGALPAPRLGHGVVYDAPRDRMLVFGGLTRDTLYNYSWLNDVWVLSMGTGSWSQVVPAGAAPEGREGASLVYDSARDRLLLFAGNIGSGVEGTLRNDVWALSLCGTPTWTLLAPIGIPPRPRFNHSAIYDPVMDRMMIFGGFSDEHLVPWLDTLWELRFSDPPEWIRVWPEGPTPLARSGHSAVYDPVRDRMVIFGGESLFGDLSDVHALSMSGVPTWSPLQPEGTPPAGRMAHAAVYDQAGGRMLVFGGSPGSGRETWSLKWGGLVGVPLPNRPTEIALGSSYPNPARGTVTIPFTIPEPCDVSLTIYDLTGRTVRTLVRRPLDAADHVAHWDGRRDGGARAAPGIYLYQLRAGAARRAGRLVLVE